jgi:Asp/Glu/hydantoin racemase
MRHTRASPVTTTVALVHAVVPAMAPMRDTLARELPDVRVLNVLDEGLLSEVERRGGLARECVDRLATVVSLGIDAGASAVLLTCNAYSPVVGDIQSRFPGVPVLAVDQVMVDEAVSRARRIGVLATVAAGLEQQRTSLQQAAERMGKHIEIVASLHPDAMAALARGDGETHDRILLDALPALAQQVELVVLAQASMARLAPKLPPDLPVPVLTSPGLAVERLRQVLTGQQTAA